MAGNIRIAGIEVYHPEKVVNNDFYVKHFESLGKDVKKLHKEIYGRGLSYEIERPDGPPDERKETQGEKKNEKENSLTMMIAAANKVLEATGYRGDQMDGIIVATQIPEFVVPACAVMVHRAIKGHENAFAHDLNSNCASMLVAFENTFRYMQSNPAINRVLIIGGEYASGVQHPDCELGYGIFGDAACALVLEKVDAGSGFIDSKFFVNNDYFDQMLFPRCGLTQIIDAEREERYATIGKVDCNIDIVQQYIEKMLSDNQLNVEQVGAFCFSQLLKKNIEILRENMNIPEEKSAYIGDIYGYTGATSPFIALYELIKNNKIKRGDFIMFWTVGAGMQHIFMLIRY